MRDRQSSILKAKMHELKMTNTLAISERPRASVLNEAKYKTFLVKIMFSYHASKTHFHEKGFAFGSRFKSEGFLTRK